jgi:hypothetical protein
MGSHVITRTELRTGPEYHARSASPGSSLSAKIAVKGSSPPAG